MSASFLKQFVPVAEALVALFHPHVEVVLHDLTTRKISAIFNSFSKRKIGDESLLDEEVPLDRKTRVIGPYSRVNWDGRNLKSITAVLRDADGEPKGLMCVNMDVSQFEAFFGVLSGLMGVVSPSKDEMQLLFRNDWREKINHYVDQYLRHVSKTLPTLSKEEKSELVLKLYQDGAFGQKNAATYVGDILGLSKATVYNYLAGKTK